MPASISSHGPLYCVQALAAPSGFHAALLEHKIRVIIVHWSAENAEAAAHRTAPRIIAKWKRQLPDEWKPFVEFIWMHAIPNTKEFLIWRNGHFSRASQHEALKQKADLMILNPRRHYEFARLFREERLIAPLFYSTTREIQASIAVLLPAYDRMLRWTGSDSRAHTYRPIYDLLVHLWTHFLDDQSMNHRWQLEKTSTAPPKDRTRAFARLLDREILPALRKIKHPMASTFPQGKILAAAGNMHFDGSMYDFVHRAIAESNLDPLTAGIHYAANSVHLFRQVDIYTDHEDLDVNFIFARRLAKALSKKMGYRLARLLVLGSLLPEDTDHALVQESFATGLPVYEARMVWWAQALWLEGIDLPALYTQIAERFPSLLNGSILEDAAYFGAALGTEEAMNLMSYNALTFVTDPVTFLDCMLKAPNARFYWKYYGDRLSNWQIARLERQFLFLSTWDRTHRELNRSEPENYPLNDWTRNLLMAS